METTNDSKMKFLKRDDFLLAYQIEGAGLECIVIGSAFFYPRVFSERFKSKLKIMYLDHRGFAKTEKPCTEEDFDLFGILEDIEYARIQANFGKILIIGHSAHGYMALEYAKRYPHAVSGVILLGTGPSHGEHMKAAMVQWEESVCPIRKAKFLTDQSKYLPMMQTFPERAFVYYCLSLEAKSWFDVTITHEELWTDVNVNMLGMNYLYGNVFREIQIEDGLEDLEIPIFLAMGRFDYLVAPYETWNPYRKYFKNLTINIFNESAHYPQIEEPDLFQTEIETWLKLNI